MENVWFWLVGWMLATYTVLGGFDIGAGILQPFVARNEPERAQVLRAIGPVWKGNEVWLVASGGTLFLAFPKLLATAFSGFYLPLMLVLWLLAFRGLAIGLRHELDDAMWRQAWDLLLPVSSAALALCLGAAVGNVVRGVPLGADGNFFEPLWTDFRVGARTGILDWYTILVGLTAVVALAHHGALWLVARTDGAVRGRAGVAAAWLAPALIFGWILVAGASYAVQPQIAESLREAPWIVVLPLLAVGALAAAVMLRRRGSGHPAFFASSAALYAMLATAASGVHPYVLPARDPAFGLTAQAAAAPPDGLALALFWWIPAISIVIAYSAYVYVRLVPKASIGDAGG